jgi:hypothetical protein
MPKLDTVETLNAPVFIVGSLRSGSTLLRLLLTHHPKINIFDEFEESVSQAMGDHWPEIESYHDFLSCDRMFQSKNLLIDKSLSYQELIHSFMEQMYYRNPKPFIGASIHSRIDLLPFLWPNARFIHLVRDPRDVSRSCIDMGWVGNVYKGAKFWIEPEQQWNTLCDRTDEKQRLTVHYEQLVHDTENCLTTICNFLGLSYHPSMLEIEADTTYSRPDPKFAKQWQNKLTPDEIQWVECQCAELMQQRGYNLCSSSQTFPNRLTRIQLAVQNRWYRIGFNIERWGLKTWFLFILSKRLRLESLRDKMQLQINQIETQYLK